MILKRVVLPAPSGPMNPNISDSFTENETSLRACVAPKLLPIPDASIVFSITPDLENRFPGHARLDRTVIHNVNGDGINQRDPLFLRLDYLRGEFGFAGNMGYCAGKG